MKNNESLTVISAWKNFTILDCVQHIGLSYTAIKQTTLTSCWKKLWPNVIKNEHSISTLNDEYSQIVQMAHSLGGEGFDDFIVNYRQVSTGSGTSHISQIGKLGS